MIRRSRFAGLVVVAMLASSCALAFRSPNIADIQHNPGRYHNRSVNIDGIVTTSWGIPLVPFHLYKVDDGTGEVTVVSQSMRTPTRGARVKVRGKVDEVAVFGGQPIGLHLREEHITVRR